MTQPQSTICPITAGFTLKMMCGWEDAIGKSRGALHRAGERPVPGSMEEKHDDIPEDHMVGGLYLLANAVAQACADVELSIGDFVFEYQHCSADENSIWLPALLRMTDVEWQQLCGNQVVPEWLGEALADRLDKLGLIDEGEEPFSDSSPVTDWQHIS